eukprot:TRINITY_DN10142_c0_g2_i1.p2 TRINITY_DN10142_c0_g2~~TRINITY_DN10142_c0_g2_i1.p2  ORF type:complete len:104 (+),score=28.73 TRINITY_DN10142_c0_g2_i1:63-374(+)
MRSSLHTLRSSRAGAPKLSMIREYSLYVKNQCRAAECDAAERPTALQQLAWGGKRALDVQRRVARGSVSSGSETTLKSCFMSKRSSRDLSVRFDSAVDLVQLD